MVRVFSVYQFNGQTIHRVPDDIRTACLIDANHLVLARFNHLIEIVSLQNTNNEFSANNEEIAADSPNDNDIQTKFTFPTVDEVIEMVYCKYGEF